MDVPNEFMESGKTIEVFSALAADKPVVYLNTFEGESRRVYEALQSICGSDFTLVAVSGLVWNHDMSPWEIPPVFKNDRPCTGGAVEYLRLLTEKIVPGAEERIPGPVLWRGLAGYSLAGLFAVYSLYQTKLFTRIASMSGSFWYPDFKDYVFSHQRRTEPERLYFSIGDREHKTKNQYLKQVRNSTETIEAYFREDGIDTRFVVNSGNHFKDSVERTAAGIAWLLGKG